MTSGCHQGSQGSILEIPARRSAKILAGITAHAVQTKIVRVFTQPGPI